MTHVNDGSIAAAVDYAKQHPDQFLQEMIDFLRIPSISTRPEHTPDVARAADWLADNMRRGGLENVTVYKTDGHPIVYADWLRAGADAPTVLFYGHYDVQPADNLNLWKSPPFEPEIRKENIYARGCSDDKGQVLILVKAVEAYLQTSGTVPVNVKFVIEGEEESGGAAISKFLPENRDLLSADVAYVADTAFADFGIPSIVYGLRGMAGVNINVTGPRLDLHSGQYGGGINNPLNAIAHIIAKLKDENGHVLVPGFYDSVRELSAQERQVIADNASGGAEMIEWTGAPAEWGEPDFTLAERLGARPTLDVNGIIGGYTGEGGKTIIPSTVHAKVTMRLVPDQDPSAIQNAVIDYVKAIAPESVTVSFEPTGSAPASISDLNHPAMQAAVTACEAVWNRAPLFKREGGSIPIVGEIQKELGAESILLGFGLPRDRLHSPNERFHLPNFYGGIETVIHFLAAYANGNE